MGWSSRLVFSTLFLLTICRGLIAHEPQYIPGHRLTWSQFESFNNQWLAALYAKAGATDVMNGWVSALETELRPALKELMQNPQTHFSYGGFNHPEERNTGKYRMVDDGAGLRIIGQLWLSHPRRFVSFLTFWTYNPAKERMELVSTQDALRVRAEITPKEYAGLSFSVESNAQGNVEKIYSEVYVTDSGEPRYPNLSHGSDPDHCNNCHMEPKPSKDRPGFWETTPYESYEGLEDFIAYLEGLGVQANKIADVRKTLESPRDFLRSKGF